MIVSPALRIRAVSAVLALVAGVGLLAYEPGTAPAAAAESDLTESAVTLEWADGIRGADGTVVQQRDEGPMSGDFADLEVTVSQSENIRSQSVHITWSGALPTIGPLDPNLLHGGYLQLMQCWGDDNAGPDPENCVWGAEGLNAGLPGSAGFRHLNLNGPPDPLLAEEDLAGYLDPTDGVNKIPFRAAGADDPVWDPAPYFDRWTSNEVRRGMTAPGGGGEANFTLKDGVEAPHLGCGLAVGGGEVRDCWLVIVPRGQHEVDGSQIAENAALVSSPLSPTNWAQRIQVHLDFDPVNVPCPIEAQQRPTLGSDFMGPAMYSWQPALCADDGAVYGYIPAPDADARRAVSGGLAGAEGLGFTSAPVTEADGPAPVLHAPVATSGLVIGFNLVASNGELIHELRLTPRLVAKLLTQSYWRDVPGLPGPPPVGTEDDRPDWLRSNAAAVVYDPEFLELNPHVDFRMYDVNASNVMKVPADPSDAVRDLWRWIFGDEEATAWLKGAPDDYGMKVNPYFGDLLTGHIEAGTTPDIIPRDVQTCFSAEARPEYCSLDLLPYTDGFEDGARRAGVLETSTWDFDPFAQHPSGQPGGWYRRPEPRQFGVAFALTDTVSAAQYGIGTALLRNAEGQFVAPTAASITAGVAAMVPTEVDGVLAVDPDASDPAAYPLPAVTYAAVRIEQEDDALADYSLFLEHAAGPGQAPGWSAGQLPRGYVPLTEDMREQTLAVAAELVHEDPPEDPPGLPAPSGQGDDGGDESGGDESGGDESGGDESGGPGPDTAGGGPGGNGDAPDPASAADDGTGDGTPPPPAGAAGDGAESPLVPELGDDVPVAQSTPGEPVGPMQYALLVVLIVGLVGALAGPAVLRLGSRPMTAG